MSKQRFCPEKTKPDVRGPAPLLQHSRVEIIVGRGTVFDNKRKHLHKVLV